MHFSPALVFWFAIAPGSLSLGRRHMSKTVSDLVSEIGQAFHGVSRPGVMLHPEGYDDSEISAFYRYERWQDIEDEDIEFENAALCFVSAEGFQFLIPAYMRFALTHLESDCNSIDATIYALCPSGDLDSFQRSKYVTLSIPQRCAIRHFLECMADHPQFVDADVALEGLENMWSRADTRTT